jgi:hypothetical protein
MVAESDFGVVTVTTVAAACCTMLYPCIFSCFCSLCKDLYYIMDLYYVNYVAFRAAPRA